jgi:hypothetical protein
MREADAIVISLDEYLETGILTDQETLPAATQ